LHQMRILANISLDTPVIRWMSDEVS
jgi:hypothetical protein